MLQKIQEKCDGKSLSNHEIALEDFIMSGINRSRVASMIYSIYKNSGKGIGFSETKSNETNLKAYSECIKEGLKTFFVPEGFTKPLTFERFDFIKKNLNMHYVSD